MNTQNKTPFEYTPACVKRLVQMITFTTLLAISLHDAIPIFNLFSLNISAITSWRIWQLITSLFLIPSPDLSFSFFLDLFFAMAVLYTAGKTVVFAFGKLHFLTLFTLGGITSGIAALIAMHITDTSYAFTETLPAILAIVVSWIMLLPFQNIGFSIFVPIKSHWLFLIAFVSTVLMNAAQGDYIRSLSYLIAFITGYLYSLTVLRLSGPFPSLHKMESIIKRIAIKLSMFWQWSVMKRMR